MSLILDYIYTGNAIVYSNILQEFLGLANLLKINTEINTNHIVLRRPKLLDEVKDFTNKSLTKNEQHGEDEYNLKNKKCFKALPNLLPINTKRTRTRMKKSVCGYVVPSPWCHRREKIFGDPKITEDEIIVSNFKLT